MNLISAIKQIQEEINQINIEHKRTLKELEDGLATLQKLNTVCEKCGGAGVYLRSRACAEDDSPDPDNPNDYIACEQCNWV